jgi:hypothetical protein
MEHFAETPFTNNRLFEAVIFFAFQKCLDYWLNIFYNLRKTNGS